MTAPALLTLAMLSWPPPQPQPAALDVVLMIDVSSSVTLGIFKRDATLFSAAASALAASLERGDTARTGAFGTTIELNATDPAIGGPSPLWDALDAAATALDGSTGRRGIIVITDGQSAGNRLGFAEVLARLEHVRVPVLVIALDFKRPKTPDPAVRLRQIADRTGGTYVFVSRDAASGAVTRAVAALRKLGAGSR